MCECMDEATGEKDYVMIWQKNVKEKLLEALYSKDSEKSLKRQQELLHELQMINDTIARMVDENAEQRAD